MDNNFDVAIKIKADAKQMESAMQSAQAKLRDFGLAIDGIQRAFTMIANPINNFIAKSEIQETAENNLIRAMKSTGIYSDALKRQLFQLSGAMQKVTIYGDEEVLAMEQSALAMGIHADKMQDAIKQAIGLSTQFRSMGLTATMSLRLIALAYKGNFGMLGRYIPQVQAAKTNQEKMNILMNAAAQGFQLAKGEINDTAGVMKQFTNLVGDLKEKIGKVYSRALIPFLKGGQALFVVLNRLPSAVTATAVAISTLISAIVIAKISGLVSALAALPGAFISIQRSATAVVSSLAAMSLETAVLTGGITALVGILAIATKKFMDMKTAIEQENRTIENNAKYYSEMVGGYGKALNEIRGQTVRGIAENKKYYDDLRKVLLNLRLQIIKYKKEGKDTSALQKQYEYWLKMKKSVDRYTDTVLKSSDKTTKAEEDFNSQLEKVIKNFDKLYTQQKNGEMEGAVKKTLTKAYDDINNYYGKVRSEHDDTDAYLQDNPLSLLPDKSIEKKKLVDNVDIWRDSFHSIIKSMEHFKTAYSHVYQQIISGIGHWAQVGVMDMVKVLNGAKTITEQQQQQMDDIVKNTTGNLKSAYALTYKQMEKQYKQHTGHMLNMTEQEYAQIQGTMKSAIDGMVVNWQEFWNKVRAWLTQLAIKLGIEAAIAAAISALSSGGVSFGTAFSMVSGAAGDMGFAEGGYIPATPGGRIIKVAEGGEGEYIVPESKMGTANVTVVVNTADPSTTVRFFKGMSYTNRRDLYQTLAEAK